MTLSHCRLRDLDLEVPDPIWLTARKRHP
jgi:hypothetical protein